MMEGHAPSWPLMLDTTDATERVPPEMLMKWVNGGMGKKRACSVER